MIGWYIAVLKNYAGFSGRSNRAEFWYFTLGNFIVGFVLGFIDGLLQLSMVLSLLYFLAILIPSFAVSFRRLHDIGKSAWWLLIAFIPFIGGLVLLYFYIKLGDENDNAFGPVPPKTPAT